MKIFPDANIFVAIVRRETKRADTCARVLGLAGNTRYKVYSTSASVATSLYFATKKHGEIWVKRWLTVLCGKIIMVHCNEAEAKMALNEKAVHDLEDALQYFAAPNAGCDYNTGDFHFSKIPVYRPDDFLFQLSQTNKRT